MDEGEDFIGHLEEMKESEEIAPKSKTSWGGDTKSKKMRADINLLIHS